MDRCALSPLALVLFAAIGLCQAAFVAGQEMVITEVVVGKDESVDRLAAAPDVKPSAKCDGSRSTCCCGRCIDWKTVPGSIRPLHRPGDFIVPPTGCGYYSLTDALHGICRDKPRKNGYPPFALMPPSFFDADFRYVESLPICDRTFSEKLKRWRLSDCVTFSTGGQFWSRYMNEQNSRLTPNNNEYNLSRVRAYGDLLVGDNLRFFGEFIWADAFGEDLAPLPIDVNLGDALNLFVEANLFDYRGKPVYARVGRQELLFGSQRLVSTLDWANTRRTFDGVRIFRTGEQWDVDALLHRFRASQSRTDSINWMTVASLLGLGRRIVLRRDTSSISSTSTSRMQTLPPSKASSVRQPTCTRSVRGTPATTMVCSGTFGEPCSSASKTDRTCLPELVPPAWAGASSPLAGRRRPGSATTTPAETRIRMGVTRTPSTSCILSDTIISAGSIKWDGKTFMT